MPQPIKSLVGILPPALTLQQASQPEQGLVRRMLAWGQPFQGSQEGRFGGLVLATHLKCLT